MLYIKLLLGQRVDDVKANIIALSRSIVQRARKKHQSKKAASIKKTFQVSGPLVLHSDVKLLPAIYGTLKKEECVAILASNF